MLAAAVLALGGLSGCRPREGGPVAVERLLPPQGEITQYRRLVLPNQLKVMLVSDPRVERSAAALAVGVGSLDNPDARPGLAHFLEHMLFLGTEKYPEAGEYQKFLSAHEGFGNAYTADDHTNHFFEVAHPALPEGLDRFAQFFIAPLFNPEYAQREVNAVDSEHSKNLENDYWRISQVQRTLYTPGHPAGRFSTGNLATLKGVDQAELRAFYRAEYSANRMTLALVGNGSLDDLEKLVRGRFDRVPNRDLPVPRRPATYLRRAEALRVLAVKPVSDQRALQVSFPLPPAERYYFQKPLELIAFILGHEGRGSLLSLLKAEHLATSLSAGTGMSTRDYAEMSISIGLTEKGLAEYQRVLAHLMGTIALLRDRGIPRYLFDENRIMAELDFRHRAAPEASRTARRLSASMQVVPLEDLPEANHLYQGYAPGLYAQFLGALTPDNLLVTLVSRQAPTERVEPIYGTRYGYRELTGEPFARLRTAKPHPRLHLPEPNPFIPRDVRVLAPRGPIKLAESSLLLLRRKGVPAAALERLQPLAGTAFTDGRALVRQAEARLGEAARPALRAELLKAGVGLPEKLLETPQARVWYLPDWRLRQPKAGMSLLFMSGETYGSARQVVLASLYEQALAESLNEIGYPIRLAGLSYGIEAKRAGVQVTLGGYSSRMVELLERLVGHLPRVEIDQGTFAAILERTRRHLENQRFTQPYGQARYYLRQLVVQPSFPVEDQLAALEGIALDDVKAYAAALFRRVYLRGAVAGNLDPDRVRVALRRALDGLGAGVLPEAERLEPEVRDLPPGADWVFTRELPLQNSLVELHYQAGRSEPRRRGALLIASRALGDAFYFSLRTRQQLGYIVYAGMGQIRKSLSLNLLVQSGAYGADHLMERAEAFVPRFVAQFADMPPDEFEKLRTAVIEAKLDKPADLGALTANLYWRAFRHDQQWDHVSTDIAAVRALTHAEVTALLREVLLGPERRRLTLRLVGAGSPPVQERGTPVELPPLPATRAVAAP